MKYDATVLYIRNETDTRKVYSDFLRKKFATVIEANDGSEGISKFMSHNPQLVITEIELSKMSGVELIHEIRKTNKNTPIIIFSAYIQEDFILDTIKDKINGFVTRPTDTKTLGRVINHVLSGGEYQTLINEKNISSEKEKFAVFPREKLISTNNDLMVVGIGANAGGLEALTLLIKGLPESNNFAYVVAQHLSPKHNTMLVELLSRGTTLRIKEVESSEELESDIFYITPPNTNIEINEDNQLILSAPEKYSILPKPSVNKLFISIAKYKKEKSLGIILSGAGSDGTQGMRAIHAEGGITIVQEPSTAKYDGMPMAALNGAIIDILIEPENIGKELLALANTPRKNVLKRHQITPENNYMSIIFSLLHKAKQVDFSVYKKATIGRRIERRMVALKVTTLNEYVKLISNSPKEVELLFKDILIGVTRFFRDNEAYQSLENHLGNYLDKTPNIKELRVWMPGASTGEEAYSVAIILNELLNERQQSLNFRIFATDIDEDALKIARRGVFNRASIAKESDTYIKDYFTISNNEFKVKKALRQNIVFSYHNLLSDPPFKDLDLIVCRNLLIYFNLDAQNWIMPAFHNALKNNGLLFLGKSENATNFEDAFAPVDKTNKIFKSIVSHKRNYAAITVNPPTYPQPLLDSATKKQANKPLQETVIAEATKLLMPNMIVTNEQLDVIYKKGDLDFITIPEGYVSFNIYKVVDSRLAMDLRKLFSELKKGLTLAVSHYIPLPHKNGVPRFIKVYLVPVLNGRNQTYIFYFQSISGKDFPFLNQTEGEPLASSSQELEFELQRTKEHMQTLIEELETSNEELQSTNEELQSAIEELQATNEEMETSNEELQSTNEELHTAYAELKEMYQENTSIKESYGALNSRYESVLNNISDGVVITNMEGVILKTNTAMQNFYRLAPEQLLAKHWITLSPLQENIDLSTREKELTENGKFGPYKINIKSPDAIDTILEVVDYLSRDEKGNSQIWSFASDISKETYARQELLLSQQKYKATFDYANIGIAHIGLNGEWISVNKSISTMLGYSEEELMKLTFQDITYAEDLENDLVFFQELLDGKSDAYKVEKRYYKKNGELFWSMLSVAIIRDQGNPLYFISVIEDINTQKSVSLDNTQAKTVFNTTQESIVIMDKQTQVINVNPAFENLTGYSINDIKGKPLSILRSGMHSDQFYNDMERAYRQSGFWSGEIIFRSKNEEVFPVYLNISAVRDYDNNIIQYVAVLTDISLIKQSQEKIQYLANHDSLTGLPNRTLLSERIEYLLQEARRSKKHIAVFFIDLDRFKIINDGLGHNVGDGVLVEVANRFSNVLRSEDTVARVGGDEFIVIAQDLESALNASKIATNLLDSIQKEMVIEGHKIKIGASIGISIYPNDGLSGDELVRQADIAMYDAKDHGRNIYRYISQELSSDAFEKATMEGSIRDALNNDEFEVYYQPIVDVQTMTLSHLEALIRWNHPKLGLIMPNKFIPLAEESDLITEITKYVTFNVMKTIHEISQSNHYDCKVAINYSLKDLESDELFFTFKKYLQQLNINGSAITLEITERKVILSNEQNQKHLARYKKLKVSFSMDDFGTGYSNLGYLINNPFDQLKIDRTFIAKIGEAGTAEEVVKATISIAKALGLKSVAEGIETKEQLEFVRANGCDLVQGFYFQIPEPMNKLIAHFTKEKTYHRIK